MPLFRPEEAMDVLVEPSPSYPLTPLHLMGPEYLLRIGLSPPMADHSDTPLIEMISGNSPGGYPQLTYGETWTFCGASYCSFFLSLFFFFPEYQCRGKDVPDAAGQLPILHLEI